ncbi:hypothetical protein FNAPI_8949 [Fusarium napiforme]|uniref:Uncharacterized protein n=1 Tax=Fusarium napiforme TaxID=42672 RepID=A0A8H5J428_9HYPO|nr:hypothetical protein FNAPI_8949 [Fusarium napiforme]
MYSSQSPSFTAEFIKEEPGKPVPQKPVRRRGLNDQIKWVKAWMSKLPQGDEDWDNNRPSTLEDILRLRDRLTISHVESRRDMDWLTLLETYAAASKDFEGRETQLHCMVMVAACHVAHDQGLTINEVMDAMAKCVTGGSDTLRSKRFALPKCVQIGDELAKSTTNREGSRARRCEGQGEIEVTDEVEVEVDGQPRQHLEFRFERGYGT